MILLNQKVAKTYMSYKIKLFFNFIKAKMQVTRSTLNIRIKGAKMTYRSRKVLDLLYRLGYKNARQKTQYGCW